MAENTVFNLHLTDFVSPTLKKILAQGETTFTALHKLNQRFNAGVKGTNTSLATLNKRLTALRGQGRQFAIMNKALSGFNAELTESITKANTLAASLARVKASQVSATGAGFAGAPRAATTGAAVSGGAAAGRRGGGPRRGRGHGRLEGLASGVLGTKTRARIGEAKGRLRGLGGAMGGGAGRGGIMASAMKSPKIAAALIPLIGGIGAGKAIFDASQFEAEMSTVKALTQATGEEIETMGRMILEASKDSIFGAEEAGQATQFLAKAGLSAKQSMDALAPTLEIATAANIDLAKAADISTDIMTMFNKEATELSGINDMLASTASSANVSIEEIFETLKKVGPIAASTNQPMSEILALIGKLGQAGVRGTEAGTQLRGMLVSLISPSKQGQDALNALGVEVRDKNKDLRNLADIMREVKEEGITGGEEVIFDIFRRRAGTAFTQLIGKNQAEIEEFAKTIREDVGRAAEMAETRTDNVVGQFRKLGGVLEIISTNFGQAFLEPLGSAIKAVREWFSEHSDWFRKAGTVVMAFVSRFETGFSKIFSMAKGGDSNSYLQFLQDILRFYRNISRFIKSLVDPLVKSFEVIFGKAREGKGVIDGLNIAMEVLIGVGHVVGQTFLSIIKIITGLARGFAGLQASAEDAGKTMTFKDVADQIRGFFGGIVEVIRGATSEIMEFVNILSETQSLFTGLGNIISGNRGLGVEQVKEGLAGIGKGVTSDFDARAAFIRGRKSALGDAADERREDVLNKILPPEGVITERDEKQFPTITGGAGAEAIRGERGSRTARGSTGPRGLIVNIDNLINELNVNTTNLKESEAQIRRFVLRALTEGVGDFEKSFSR